MLDSRGPVGQYRDIASAILATPGDYQDNLLGTAERPPWKVRTRAFTWSEPLNPKALDHAELEFDRSHALVDIDVIQDGESARRLASKIRTGHGALIVPAEPADDDYT